MSLSTIHPLRVCASLTTACLLLGTGIAHAGNGAPGAEGGLAEAADGNISNASGTFASAPPSATAGDGGNPVTATATGFGGGGSSGIGVGGGGGGFGGAGGEGGSDASASGTGVITQIYTSPAYSDPLATDATLISFKVGGVIYGSPTAATGVINNTETEYAWGNGGGATDPVNLATAVTDLNMVTGSLGGGTAAIYQFSSIAATDMFYVFSNGTANFPGVIGVDSSGADITSELEIAGRTALLDLNLNRSTGGTLIGRDLNGYAFPASALSFTGGNTLSDLAGLRLTSDGYDIHEVGFAVYDPGNPGGVAYGDAALTNHYGGSGGAAGVNDSGSVDISGGGGGGALQVVAVNSLIVGPNAAFDLSGGDGELGAREGGGGGSGGALVLAGYTVDIDGSAALNVSGGTGGETVTIGYENRGGGGGGGGRVAVFSTEDFNADGEDQQENALASVSLTGGAGTTGGLAGISGTFYDGAVPAFATPEPFDLVTTSTGNGNITPAGSTSVTFDTNVTVTATADTYYYVSVFTANGVPQSLPDGMAQLQAQVEFQNVSSNLTAHAEFAARETSHGTPYWWLAGQELTGDPETEAAADQDGDGHATWEEYVFGTDPNDAASTVKLKISTDENPPPNTIVLEWPTVMGRLYTVREATTLTGTTVWADVPEATDMPGTGGMLQHAVEIENTKEFFSIKVEY